MFAIDKYEFSAYNKQGKEIGRRENAAGAVSEISACLNLFAPVVSLFERPGQDHEAFPGASSPAADGIKYPVLAHRRKSQGKSIYFRKSNEFVFTAGEQEFYAERGFQNEPQRCKACRDARKNATRGPREYFTATCAACGGEARVPFEPRSDRPVYCSDCFARMKNEG